MPLGPCHLPSCSYLEHPAWVPWDEEAPGTFAWYLSGVGDDREFSFVLELLGLWKLGVAALPEHSFSTKDLSVALGNQQHCPAGPTHLEGCSVEDKQIIARTPELRLTTPNTCVGSITVSTYI